MWSQISAPHTLLFCFFIPSSFYYNFVEIPSVMKKDFHYLPDAPGRQVLILLSSMKSCSSYSHMKHTIVWVNNPRLKTNVHLDLLANFLLVSGGIILLCLTFSPVWKLVFVKTILSFHMQNEVRTVFQWIAIWWSACWLCFLTKIPEIWVVQICQPLKPLGLPIPFSEICQGSILSYYLKDNTTLHHWQERS